MYRGGRCQDRFDPVRCHAESGRGKISGSAADYEIDLTVVIAGRFQRRGESIVVTHIRRMPGRRAARLRYLVYCSIQFLLGAADQGHLGAVIGKTSGDCEIDPAATAGDDGIFPGQQLSSEHFRHSFSATKQRRNVESRTAKPTYGAKSLKVVSLSSVPSPGAKDETLARDFYSLRILCGLRRCSEHRRIRQRSDRKLADAGRSGFRHCYSRAGHRRLDVILRQRCDPHPLSRQHGEGLQRGSQIRPAQYFRHHFHFELGADRRLRLPRRIDWLDDGHILGHQQTNCGRRQGAAAWEVRYDVAARERPLARDHGHRLSRAGAANPLKRKPRTLVGYGAGYWWPTRPTSSTSSTILQSRRGDSGLQ